MSDRRAIWEQVSELCDAALALEGPERSTFLASACHGDEALRREVESLLVQEPKSEQFLTECALERMAHSVLRDSRGSLVGQRLGPYEVVAVIAAGGMGDVYKARDTRLDRTVAIKVLPPQVTHDPHARKRFEREARAVGALNHPHICTLYDIGRQDDIDFLVMEYLEGATLRGPLPVEEVTRLARQITAALAAAHRHGILHRDLKPSNVMLTPIGAKLLDFGLATSMDADADAARPGERAVIGTLAYMSPEQAEGKPLDARSDVFSFGAVLYEMLSGKRAFSGTTAAQVLSRILHDNPPAIGGSSALDQIVQRCLAKEPARRFQTIEDVRGALEQASLTPAVEPPSIAVLAFANMSADAENEFFSDGLAEEIIIALTRIDALHVVARSSSFSFKGKGVEIAEIAKRLKVRYVLDGSVRKAGNGVRVTAQLVDASKGYQLWSERYDGQMADIFLVQEEIARAIVDRLKVGFSGSPGGRLVKAATNNMEAYQQYLRGRAMLYRRGPSLLPALESLQKAVDLDPQYAQALAGLADARTISAYSGFSLPSATLPLAHEAATRAVAADPAGAEAHNALAATALLWERDFEKAERHFLEALSCNPHYIQARCWYGLFFLQLTAGRAEEGLVEIWRAVEADPLSAYTSAILSMALEQVKQRQEAVRWARFAVEQDPESFISRFQLGNACQWSGQIEESLAIYQPLWAQSHHHWVALEIVPAYVKAGRVPEARSVYEALLSRREREHVPPFLLSSCLSALGDHEGALRFCEEAIEIGDPLFALFHRWTPNYDRVRADERFGGIMARFNAKLRLKRGGGSA